MNFLKINDLDSLWLALKQYKKLVDENNLEQEDQIYNLGLVIEDAVKRFSPTDSNYGTKLWSQKTSHISYNKVSYPRNIEELKSIKDNNRSFFPSAISDELYGTELLIALMKFYNIHKSIDLAQATSINKSALSRVLSGHRNISAGMAVKFSKLFKYPSDRFLKKIN